MVRAQVVKSQEAKPDAATNRRGYWDEEIRKGIARYRIFRERGDQVQDRYRLERANGNSDQDLYRDRYNILYSSTETAKPSLYAQTPKVQAQRRHKDRNNDTVLNAVMMLEAAGQYALEEVDFDGVMKNVIQDFLLPGMGVAWVRYAPVFGKRKSDNDNEADQEYLSFEGMDVDYVHYCDFITGVGRVWKELPWIARRVYFTREKAEARFGKDVANKLQYSFRPNDDGNGNKAFAGNGGFQAIIWEIWDKVNRKVIWYSEDYASDVIEEINDPLHLKDFYPCPEPIRAVWTTRTFIPKAFYSQYKAQAEELDNITERIRWLTQALRVCGVYDSSQPAIGTMLNATGNRLIPVDNWAMFAERGGIKGAIDYFPIKEVSDVLANLLQQREVVKGEIYEITGFSDIVRGVSKASETLGAQQIKNEWAGGRLRDWQKEVQRFCRDIIRIMSEIMAEHFSTDSWALYAGFEPPEITPEEQSAAAQYATQLAQYQQSLTLIQIPGQPPVSPPQKPPPTMQQVAVQQFEAAVNMLKDERQRCAQIGIETDSTIMPDEIKEREDRMQFLSSAGAFLQQAGPMAMQYPDMRGLLGAIMMFTIRTFRSSRPLEKEFEEFTKKLQSQPPMPAPGQEGKGADNGEAAAQAQVQTEQLKQQGEQAKIQAQQQEASSKAELEKYKIDTEAAIERERMAMEAQYKERELSIKERELALREAELGIKVRQTETDTALRADDQVHRQQMDQRQADSGDAQFLAGEERAARQFEADQEREEND